MNRVGEKKIWFTSNWVYCSFLDCVMLSCVDEDELFNEFLQAKYMQSLSLIIIEEDNPDLKDRVIAAVQLGVENVINGKCPPAIVEGRILDERSQEQYVEAIETLVSFLESELPRRNQND